MLLTERVSAGACPLKYDYNAHLIHALILGNAVRQFRENRFHDIVYGRKHSYRGFFVVQRLLEIDDDQPAQLICIELVTLL